MTFHLANRMQRLRTSDIREILRITQRPSMISFAGGLPAAGTFPVEELKAIALEVLGKEGAQALQYSTSEGHPVLREQIACRMRERQGAAVTADEILVTAGWSFPGRSAPGDSSGTAWSETWPSCRATVSFPQAVTPIHCG